MQMYFVFSLERDASEFLFRLATAENYFASAVYNMRNQRHKFQAELEREREKEIFISQLDEFVEHKFNRKKKCRVNK